jgi:hypothetical protein
METAIVPAVVRTLIFGSRSRIDLSLASNATSAAPRGAIRRLKNDSRLCGRPSAALASSRL